MNRPTRKLNHLQEKVASKETRTPGKAGKRLKRWRKWIKAYEAVVTPVATQA